MRRFLIALLLMLILILGGGLYVWSSASSLLAHHIGEALQTQVTVDALSFRPSLFSIHNLKIDNPRGYVSRYALTVQETDFHAPYLNYLHDPLLIQAIDLSDVFLDIEFTDDGRTQGNWVTLINNVSVNQPTSHNSYSVINTLTIKNLNLTIKLKGKSPQRLAPIAELTFTNVRTDNGRLVQELTEIIVKKMMGQVLLQKAVKTILDLPSNLFQGIF